MKMSEILPPWVAVNTALGLSSPIRDETHYGEMLAFVDECFAHFGADDCHPIFVLVGLVAARIRDYEDQNHPWPGTSAPESGPPPTSESAAASHRA